MTQPAPVQPFTADDPLCYPELTPEQCALRVLLAVLADTGTAVLYPADDLLPDYVQVQIAAGWTLTPRLHPGPQRDGSVLLTAVRHPRLFPSGLPTTPPAGQP